MKPLMVGPRDGPANGAKVKSASALPRVFASHMSPISALAENTVNRSTYPLITSALAAKVPLKNRNTRIEPLLRDSAHPTVKPVYAANDMSSGGLRP